MEDCRVHTMEIEKDLGVLEDREWKFRHQTPSGASELPAELV